MHSWFWGIAAVLASTPGSAAQSAPRPLLDINVVTPDPSSTPGTITPFGARAIFAATTWQSGREVWLADLANNGVDLLTDLNPGVGNANPRVFVTHGNRVFFIASDASSANVYATDGTAAGTQLLFRPSAPQPTWIASAGNNVFFGSNGQLYRTDGTAAGTVPLTVFPLSVQGPVADLGSVLLLRVRDSAAGTELWRTDGTAAGTVLVADIRQGPGESFVGAAVRLGNQVIFTADDGTHGQELWRTDGTTAGTNLIVDLNPGTLSGASPIGAGPGFVYAIGNDGVSGTELWRTDGTAAGTTLIKDLTVQGDSQIRNATVVGGRLFFAARTTASQWQEPHVSDGTTPGTGLITALNPGSGSNGMEFGAVGNQVLIRAEGAGVGAELFVTDGTVAGTRLLRDIWPGADGSGPSGLAAVGSSTLFTATEPNGDRELWITDGTPGGTRLFADIDPPLRNNSSSPTGFGCLGANTYFTADDGTERAMWRTDGTPAGTVRLPSGGVTPEGGVMAHGGQLVFVGRSAALGTELFVSDGIGAPVLLHEFSPGIGNTSLDLLTPSGSGIYFRVHNAGTWTLGRTDGTPAGTYVVRDPTAGGPKGVSTLEVSGELVFMMADGGVGDREPWRSDGTAAGTYRLADIVPGPTASVAGGFTRRPKDGWVFAADDRRVGMELWRTDGTPAGTALLADLAPGTGGSFPLDFTVLGARLLFAAGTPAYGRELWVLDEGSEVPRLLADIKPGSASGVSWSRAEFGGRLFFFADDGVHGIELWSTDGTTAGTSMLLDMTPGPAGSGPAAIHVANNRFMLFVSWLAGAPRLWASDGTAAGTRQIPHPPGVTDLALAGSTCGGRMLLIGATVPTGREPWVMDVGAHASSVGWGCDPLAAAPTLRATDPILGSTVLVSGTLAGPAVAFLLLGLEATRPFALSPAPCALFLRPPLSVVAQIPVRGAGWALPLPVPSDPILIDFEVGLQSVSVRPGGEQALSPGLRLHLGR